MDSQTPDLPTTDLPTTDLPTTDLPTTDLPTPPEPVKVDISELIPGTRYSFDRNNDKYEGTFVKPSYTDIHPQYIFDDVVNKTKDEHNDGYNFARQYPNNFIAMKLKEGGKSRKTKSRHNSRKSRKTKRQHNSRKSAKRNNRKR